MTVARRLATLEGSLTPTEIILTWLEEAHAFESLDAYVGWQLDQPDDGHVPDRLLFQARDAARARAGRRKDADEIVRQALRDTPFRFELVLRTNVLIHETIDREARIELVIGLRFGMLFSERDDPSTGAACADTLLLADHRWRHLGYLDTARTTVEAHYLAGHPALFPAERRRLAEAIEETGHLVAMGAWLGELDRWLPPGEPESPEAQAALIAGLVDDLTEPAKVHALEKLDEGRRAFGIATRWLRPKVGERDGPRVGDVGAGEEPRA